MVAVFFVVIVLQVLVAQEQQLTALLQVPVDDAAVVIVAFLVVDPVILHVEQEQGARFFVDMVAPEIAFHGGFVSNPLLRNVAGYMSPPVHNHMLQVELYDGESGIYMRPDHPEWVWDPNCDDNRPPDPRVSCATVRY